MMPLPSGCLSPPFSSMNGHFCAASVWLVYQVGNTNHPCGTCLFFSIMGFEKYSNLVHGWINVGNKKGNRLSDNKQTIGVDLNHSSSMEQAAFAFIAIHKQRHNYVYLFMYLSTIQTKSTQSSCRSSQTLHVIVSLW